MADIEKVGLSTGPESSSESAYDPDREMMSKLIQAFDDLREAIVSQKEEAAQQHHETIQHHLIVQNKPVGAADNAIGGARDVENLNHALNNASQNMKGIVEQFTSHLSHLSVMGGQFLDANVRGLAGQVTQFGAGYGRQLGHEATQMLHTENPLLEGAVQGFTSKLANAALGLEGLIGGTAGVVAGLASFTVALGAATAVFALFEGFAMLQGVHDFNKMIETNAPGASASIRGSNHHSVPHLYEELGYGIYHRSDKEKERLMTAALQLRPGAGTSMNDVTDMAWTMGYLEDYGVSQDASRRTGIGMTKDLGMNFGQTANAMKELSDVAKMRGYDISSYMDKVVQLSKTVQGFGVTLADVNKVFQHFADATLLGGMKLSYDQAGQATEMYLNMRQKLTMGEAAYIATHSGANLTATDAGGLYGTGGETLGNLANRGSLGMLEAAMLVKASAGMPGSFKATADFHTGRVQDQMAGINFAGYEEHTKKNTQMYLMAQSMGYGDKFLSGDKATHSLVKDLVDGKILSDEEFGKKMKELSMTPLEEFKKEFINKMDKTHTELVKHEELFKSFNEMWTELKRLLAGVAIPVIEKIGVVVATLGDYLMHGGVNNYEKYNQMMVDINKDPAMAAVFEGNPLAKEFRDKLGVGPNGTSGDFNHTAPWYEKAAVAGGPFTAIPYYGGKALIGGIQSAFPHGMSGDPSSQVLGGMLSLNGILPSSGSYGGGFVPGMGQVPSVAGKPMSNLDGLKAFASKFGYKITSTTGGKHSPGSNHYSGRAIDIDHKGVNYETLKANADYYGLRLLDEVRHPSKYSSGPHYHLDIPKNSTRWNQMLSSGSISDSQGPIKIVHESTVNIKVDGKTQCAIRKVDSKTLNTGIPSLTSGLDLINNPIKTFGP